jgi:hypothetical protein
MMPLTQAAQNFRSGVGATDLADLEAFPVADRYPAAAS